MYICSLFADICLELLICMVFLKSELYGKIYKIESNSRIHRVGKVIQVQQKGRGEICVIYDR